ncbi:MAG: hypothetical protein NWF05_03040 [Candidatus Bathyarchaeota archaeon]|nr:hypothetical protein [Candidatus Bathyarchaeota archaeon]
MRRRVDLLLIIVISLVAASTVLLPALCTEQITAQNQARAFIENVLPIDLSKYQLSLTKQSTLELPNGDLVDTIRYTLDSNESTVKVTLNIQKSVVLSCHITEKNGSIIKDKQYPSLVAAVKGVLERYAAYSRIDSTKAIAMLDDIDVAKNASIIQDNTKLIVTNLLSGNCITYFEWAHFVNGAEYTSLQLGFQKDGTMDYLRDDRAIYTIGDTSINISREQAIEIALENLWTYSYKMPDQTVVQDFNVTKDKDRIGTKLVTASENGALRPYWDIRMPLNQTYPGSVQGITAFIWANTGEIISYSNIAYGGVNSNIEITPSPTDIEITPSPTDIEITPSAEANSQTSPSQSEERNPATPDFDGISGIALCITGIIAVLAAALLFLKAKKQKQTAPSPFLTTFNR